MTTFLLTHKKTGRSLPLRPEPHRVGRGVGNHLTLGSSTVSHQHALLEPELAAVWVTDLNSRNGTFVNGARLAPGQRTRLVAGSEVRFGESTAFVLSGGPASDLLPETIIPGLSPVPNASPLQEEPLLTALDARPCDARQRRQSAVPKQPSRTTQPTPVERTQFQSSPPDFGFEPNRVDFEREGVGTEAAARLRDRFRPIRVLSTGGMGKILLVQEVLSGRFVAMKVMLEHATADRALVEQFVREAVITARLQHPHIIPVHDLGFLSGDQLYYTMSYIDGVSLRKLVGKASLLELVRILRSAALAVDYAHTTGLWHRDLKPDNVLIGPLGDTYVIDWGLVTVRSGATYKLNIPEVAAVAPDLVAPDNLLEETPNALSSVVPPASFPGRGAIGTPLYMSPEQFRDRPEELGPGSDVWAFGMMMYEALTGIHPLQVLAGNALQFRTLKRYVGAAFPPPRQYNPTVPDELEALCLRMLEKDHTRRPDRLAEFLHVTTDYLKHQAVAVSSYGLPARPRADELEALRMENELLKAEVSNLRQQLPTRT